MRVFLNTLLLIALLVQLPFGALAAYSDLNHPHAQHHHSHDMVEHSHHHDAQPANSEENSQALNFCATQHHCSGTHLSALPTLSIDSSVATARQVFDARSETLLPSAAHTRIERPNWASA